MCVCVCVLMSYIYVLFMYMYCVCVCVCMYVEMCLERVGRERESELFGRGWMCAR